MAAVITKQSRGKRSTYAEIGNAASHLPDNVNQAKKFSNSWPQNFDFILSLNNYNIYEQINFKGICVFRS